MSKIKTWYDNLTEGQHTRLLVVTALVICAASYVILAKKDKEEPTYVPGTVKATTTVPTTTGQLVQEIKTDPATSRQLRAMSDTIFNLRSREKRHIKEITRLSQVKQNIDLSDIITAAYTAPEGPLPTSPDSLLKVPAPFNYKTDEITVSGTVLKSGVRIDTLHLENTMFARDVVQKTGFLNLGRKKSTQLFNTNTLWRNDSAAVYVVPHELTWWQKTGKPATAAVITAAVVLFIANAVK